jgi:hypothetical protein
MGTCIWPIEHPFHWQVIKREILQPLITHKQIKYLACYTNSDINHSACVYNSFDSNFLNSLINNYPTINHLFPKQVIFLFHYPAIWRVQIYSTFYFLFHFFTHDDIGQITNKYIYLVGWTIYWIVFDVSVSFITWLSNINKIHK